MMKICTKRPTCDKIYLVYGENQTSRSQTYNILDDFESTSV